MFCEVVYLTGLSCILDRRTLLSSARSLSNAPIVFLSISQTPLANVTSKPHILKNISSAHYSQEPKSDVRRNPFKATLEAGKKYHWCFCGHSKKVPFCDGSHKDESLKTTKRPIKFVVEETKPYALCNCQRSKKAPFCDGTHKKPDPETATT